jgi:hypothetical protein
MVQAVRRYRNPNRHDNGYVYRSVTNVTGALPKPALVNWAARVTAETAVEQLAAWREMPAMDAIEWLKAAPNRGRDRAAARGTTVHAVIDNMVQGKSYEVEQLVEPWVASAMKFYHEARPRPERTETSVYDERTLCAGTFDFLGRLDAAPELGRVLIDWKTSKGVYADMAVQLVGGYLYGSEYILDDDANEIEWHEPDSALIVHFSPDGYSIRPVPKDRTLRRAFLGALEIRKWEDEGPQIGEPYQLKLDLPPSSSELTYFRARLFALSPDQQLRLHSQCVELGLTTKIKDMTVDDLDRIGGLIGLYEMEEKEEAKPRRSSRRPMP